MSDKRKASRSRGRLRQALHELESAVEGLLGERGPIVKGNFQLRGTRCGKDNCKCNQGELHSTAILVVSEAGKRRSFYVRGTERPEVQRRAERYRRVRATRAKLRKLSAEIVAAADELLDALAEPHQPQRDEVGLKTTDSSPARGTRHRGH